MKRTYLLVGLLVAVGLIVAGLFVAKGPQPEIVVPAEVITRVGFLNITNTMITAWVVMAVLILLGFFATRTMSLAPSGFQNFMEAAISFLFDQMSDIAGETAARRFFPVIATIFLFVLASNWMGLLPFFNAIGKVEDVNHLIFENLASGDPGKLTLGEDGHYIEGHKFAGTKMGGSGSFFTIKPGASAIDFHVEVGETPGEAVDRYIVFIANKFSGFEATADELAHPSAETVVAAAAALDGSDPDAPLLVLASTDSHGAGEEGGEGHHAIASPALHADVEGIDFSDASQRFGLVIPFFRGVYSDVNNTLALGLIAFVMIEFWGFQSLGFGYLKKFINFSSPIAAFVGLLELLSEFIRVISFAFRLFGNIFAGEVLVLMLTFLMPFLLVDIIYGLELFVGFIQAAVFALLTLVFGVMAIEAHGDDDHHDGSDAGDAHHAAHPTTSGAAQAH